MSVSLWESEVKLMFKCRHRPELRLRSGV